MSEAQNDWIKRVLGFVAGADRAGGAEAGAPSAENDVATLQVAMPALGERVRQAIQNAPDRQDALAAALRAFQQALGKGDAATARKLVAALTGAIDRLAPVTSSGGAMPATGALSVWQAAKDSVDDQLRQLSDRLRKLRIPVLNDLAADVEQLFEGVRVTMTSALMSFDQAGPDKRAQARDAALAAVAGTRSWLEKDGRGRIQAVEANGLGVPVPVRNVIGAALQELERKLAASN